MLRRMNITSVATQWICRRSFGSTRRMLSGTLWRSSRLQQGLTVAVRCRSIKNLEHDLVSLGPSLPLVAVTDSHLGETVCESHSGLCASRIPLRIACRLLKATSSESADEAPQPARSSQCKREQTTLQGPNPWQQSSVRETQLRNCGIVCSKS